ncbi:alpha/beta hydrolase [Prauserella oleivorans]|uniref:Alpha/beta hydrolase n=1 Tax=Prauserella oleivorans TaxID=1478153 RepID=A0ABW5WAJ3_9PSEU
MTHHSTVDLFATSPEFDDLVARLRASPFAADTTPIDELRANFERFAAGFNAVPDGADIRPDTLGGVPVEWVSAPGSTAESIIIYLHGGGFAIGTIEGYRGMAARLSSLTGSTVVTVGYRLAPENPYPAALDDCVSVVRAVLDTGIDAARVAVAGDSAGGGLTLSVLVRLRDDGSAMPGAAVCLSPLADLAYAGDSVRERAHLDPIVTPAGSHSYAVRYLGSEDADFTDPGASPLFADLHGLPPVLIVVGTSEVLFDDAVRVARRIREAGGRVDLDVWPRMIHILPFFAAQIPESLKAMEEIGAYLRLHLAGGTGEGSR